MLYQPQFPQALAQIAPALLQRLSRGEAFEPFPGFTVQVRGELLHAPYRVYYDERNLQQCIQKTSGPAQILALCLGSRHSNGHVREACLRQLLQMEAACNQDWVVPFVIRLSSDYVRQIAELVADHIPQLSTQSYGCFAAENPDFITLRKQQVASYWDCYHRAHYPRLRLHPGMRFLRWVEQARELR